MKKTSNNIVTIVAATMLTITSYAQMADHSDLSIASNQKISKNLPAGLDERVSIATDQPVEWSKSKYGYTGSYNLDETHYMATFDNESHYIETYEKIDWNNSRVSSVVRNSLLTSLYKDYKVIAYWVSSDPDENGYYLELKDKTGKQFNVWADNKGNLYDRPQQYRTETLNGAQ